MFKKLLIAAVAVTAGLVVLTKVTGVSLKTCCRDFCTSAKRMVPLDVRHQQLVGKIGEIDEEIKKNLSQLARMEVEVGTFEKQLQAKRDRQTQLRAEIDDMRKALETRTEKVSFHGRRYRTADLTGQLDMAVTTYAGLKEQIKLQEPILVEKNRALEAAKARIVAKKNAKEKLRLVATRIETQIEIIKMKQMQNGIRDIDDSIVGECNALVGEIEVALREADAKARLFSEFGYGEKSTLEKEGKSTEEVLKSAREALQDDDQGDRVAVEKK
jgi:predicted  nucleic acid-binding Zn-ribbon protein